MSGAIYQAAAGALLQQMRLEMLSNNLANANTTGFKSDIPVFRLAPESLSPEAEVPSLKTHSITPPMEAITDFSSGAVVKTDNPLNVAIVGRGFFEVQTPDGPRYTRNGSFSINADGLLCTALGDPVMGQSGEITIDGGNIAIGELGEVFVDGQQVDVLKVVDFPEPYKLQKSGESFFVPDDLGQETILEDGFHIAQGFVESSNVNTIRTMTDMIETMRVFEAYQKVIQSSNETTARTVNEIAGTI